MHKIGKSYKIYTTNFQNLDTTKYIFIPDWDFHWQGFYMFQKIQKLAINTRLWGEAFYDNTTNNPDNPSNPPIAVVAGEHTTDEMMITFVAYTSYQNGDEDIILDSTAFVANKEIVSKKRVSFYPNPITDAINIEGFNTISAHSFYCITNVSGATVREGQLQTSKINLPELLPGIYFIKIVSDKEIFEHRFVKQ
jgi:hypothetical protein